MEQTIVVSTNPDRTEWVERFMASYQRCQQEVEIVVISTWHFELGAIWKAHHLGLHRFIFLQDSVQIHDWDQFLDDCQPHDSALIIPRPNCYLSVFNRRVLLSMDEPARIAKGDKEAAITGETVFMDEYTRHARREGLATPTIYPTLTDGEALAAERYGNFNGEQRLALSNGIITKWKGTWR